MDVDTVLAAIGSQEESDFSEFCRGLGDDCPVQGDTAAWRELFATLNEAERQGYVRIDRAGRNIESLILTEEGASRVRAKLDSKRGLLQAIGD